VERRQFKQEPPHPFDLTTLQTEAYRSMRIQPKDTLALAQELYVAGLISYPRTSSQVLPKEIDYRKILADLSGQEYYKGYAQELLKKKDLEPNNGKKTDPAHPAIFPTGQIQAIEGRQAKIYDIIVRRFLATFGDPATRETMEIDIDVNAETFLTKGTRTVVPGWHAYYGPHVKLEEEELPPAEQGQEVQVKEISLLDKQTQPPKRYTPASIIKELERRNLGTKATRAAIVDALYQRGYVVEESLQATELGIRTCETLEKHCPSILDEELTRHFEEEMDAIREDRKKGDDVLHEAKEVLTAILKDFKAKEKEVGKDLASAMKETNDEINYIGACQKCGEGTLQIRRGRFGRFIACNKYPGCKTTFSLPASGMVKAQKKDCEQCGFPLINIRMARKRPQIICINPACPTKKVDEAKAAEEKPCAKCGTGKMVLRRSIYGAFLGCSNYPKCRSSERLAVAEAPAEDEERDSEE
jgi:DNA topoisomerase-1